MKRTLKDIHLVVLYLLAKLKSTPNNRIGGKGNATIPIT